MFVVDKWELYLTEVWREDWGFIDEIFWNILGNWGNLRLFGRELHFEAIIIFSHFRVVQKKSNKKNRKSGKNNLFSFLFKQMNQQNWEISLYIMFYKNPQNLMFEKIIY